jgi:hypothetical protein
MRSGGGDNEEKMFIKKNSLDLPQINPQGRVVSALTKATGSQAVNFGPPGFKEGHTHECEFG